MSNELIHWLNQRYKKEWDRAERLQAELDNVYASRAWRVVSWMRRIKAWLRRSPSRAAEHYPTQDLDGMWTVPSGKVSIVIPFRDRGALLQNLVNSLRHSTYRPFEVILIDNGTTCPRTRRYVGRLAQKRGVRVLACPERFHFARLCNQGAARARGDFLLFLNNDMEVLTPDWLEQLVGLACQPCIGVVGATLLYPDDTIQHAGIFPQSTGDWGHAYRGLPGEHAGERGELRHVRAVPAVTGACLMIRRELFRQMGGFDERFPVTGNDVDLCCRVRERGLMVAITPHARLLHFESLSRGYAREPR